MGKFLMPGDFLKGAACALSGFKLVRLAGARRYVVLPLLINIILFAAVFWYAFIQTGHGVETLMAFLPNWLDWLGWLLWPLFLALALIVLFFTFTLVANIIGSPFNGLLAEKLEAKLTGVSPPSSGQVIETLLALKNSVLSEFGKFGYLITRALPLLIFSFIPGLNIFAPLLWFGFGAWMLALEYMDYPMGNHGMTFREERQRLSNHRGLMLGFGSVIMLITLAPILNFLAMPVAVAGATQLWIKHVRNKEAPN
jgi:CysZ protein